MADHFSVIGFKASSAEALSTLISALVEKGGEKQPCAPGYYHRLHSRAGPSFGSICKSWLRASRIPIHTKPLASRRFSKAKAGRRSVSRHAPAPHQQSLEGTFYVELGPTIALIDVVDLARFAGKPVPFMAIAQIAAFPHELAVYGSEAAFQAMQADKSVKITPRSFLASGLFAGGGSSDLVFLDPEAEDFRAPARAFLTGEVQKTERRMNPETGQEFTWALIGTAGGTFDLVADDAVLPHARLLA